MTTGASETDEGISCGGDFSVVETVVTGNSGGGSLVALAREVTTSPALGVSSPFLVVVALEEEEDVSSLRKRSTWFISARRRFGDCCTVAHT